MVLRDPVCGMPLEPDGPIFTSERLGKTYYFCSENCMHNFSGEPQNRLLLNGDRHKK